MARYSVQLFDRCGIFKDVAAPTFTDALIAARDLASKHPTHPILVFNLDEIDLNFDGLTFEQGELVADYVAEGRRIAVTLGRTGT